MKENKPKYPLAQQNTVHISSQLIRNRKEYNNYFKIFLPQAD